VLFGVGERVGDAVLPGLRSRKLGLGEPFLVRGEVLGVDRFLDRLAVLVRNGQKRELAGALDRLAVKRPRREMGVNRIAAR